MIENRMILDASRPHPAVDMFGIRRTKQIIRAENAKYGRDFVKIPHDEVTVNPNFIEAWRNNILLVQVWEGPPLNLKFTRTELDERGCILAGITWDQMFLAKNEIAHGAYADLDFVEFFPAAENLINVANVRHLYQLETPFTLTSAEFKKELGS